MGHTRIHALATQIDPEHKFVFRLELCYGSLDRSIHASLPLTAILKKLKTDWGIDADWEKKKLERHMDFQREKETYEKLKPLQGRDIPILYGEVECDGRPALLLSDIDGKAVCDLDAQEIGEERLRGMIEIPIRNMLNLGVEHCDLKLDNFHVIGGSSGRVMVLDFENVDPRRSADTEGICNELVDFLLKAYRRTIKGKEKWKSLGLL